MCICNQFPCICGGRSHGAWSPFAPSFGSPGTIPNAGPGTISQTVAQYIATQKAANAFNHTYQNTLASQAGLMGIPAGGMGLGGLPPNYVPPNLDPLEKAGTAFGEFVGWRMWQLRDGYLQSYTASYVWVPGIATEGKPGDHDGGGLWAFKDPAKALHKLLENGVPSAMGSVWMYGDIVEHSDGYRAQYAMVRSIDEVHLPRADNHRWWEMLRKSEKGDILKALRERYQLTNSQ